MSKVNKMVTNFRIIFIFIYGIIHWRLSHGSEVLTTVLNDLTEFFEKLKTKYGMYKILFI